LSSANVSRAGPPAPARAVSARASLELEGGGPQVRAGRGQTEKDFYTNQKQKRKVLYRECNTQKFF
jgi:hypothetical protein